MATSGGIGMFSRLKRQADPSTANEAANPNYGTINSRSDSDDAASDCGSFHNKFFFRPPSRENEVFCGFQDYDEAATSQATFHDNESPAQSTTNVSRKPGIGLFARLASQQQITDGATNASDFSQEQLQQSFVVSTVEVDSAQNSNSVNQRAYNFSQTKPSLITPNKTSTQGFAMFARREANQSSTTLSERSDFPQPNGPGAKICSEPDAFGNSHPSKESVVDANVSTMASNLSHNGIPIFTGRASQASMINSPATTRLVQTSAPAASPASFTPSHKPIEMGTLVTPDDSLLSAQNQSEIKNSQSRLSNISNQPSTPSGVGIETGSKNRATTASEQETFANAVDSFVIPSPKASPAFNSMHAASFVNAKITPSRPQPSPLAPATAACPSNPAEDTYAPTGRQSNWTASNNSAPDQCLQEFLQQPGRTGEAPVLGEIQLASTASSTATSSVPASFRDVVAASSSAANSAADFSRENGTILPTDENIEAIYAEFTLKCRDINERQNYGQAQLLDMEVRYEKSCYEIHQHQANLLDLLFGADFLESEMDEVFQHYKRALDVQAK